MPTHDLPHPANAEPAQPKKVWVTPEIQSQSIQTLTLVQKGAGTPEGDNPTAYTSS